MCSAASGIGQHKIVSFASEFVSRLAKASCSQSGRTFEISAATIIINTSCRPVCWEIFLSDSVHCLMNRVLVFFLSS